jgi:hypothetical protein
MANGLAERGILIVENDATPFNDHYPFHGLAPITEQYAVAPIRDGFNWAERLREVTEGQWYLVVFRSVRRATADVDVLTEFDDHAHTEALDAGGLMYYFRGELGGDRECLSFCLWETQEQAKAALRLPRHQAAVRVAREMYESYLLERYILTKHRESAEIEFQHLS